MASSATMIRLRGLALSELLEVKVNSFAILLRDWQQAGSSPIPLMRLGLTYNLRPDQPLSPGEPDDRFEELDIEETIDAIDGALRGLGHEVERLGWGRRLLGALASGDPSRFD